MPPIEIVVAGDRPDSIDLAARLADGWVAPTETFESGLAVLRASALRAGRRAGLPRTYVVQELRRDRPLDATPFGADPAGWLDAWASRGADSAIVTVRRAADVTALAACLAALR